MNRWNSADCAPELILIGPSKLTLQCMTYVRRYASVRAELANSFYYEVKIIEMSGSIFIGLAPNSMPLNAEPVGGHPGTYSYWDCGCFFGHTFAGCQCLMGIGPPYIDGKPYFGVGDTIGCGMDPATRQIMYTKNGVRLDTTNLLIGLLSAEDRLYPCVTLQAKGDRVEANFGQHRFVYDLAKKYTRRGKNNN